MKPIFVNCIRIMFLTYLISFCCCANRQLRCDTPSKDEQQARMRALFLSSFQEFKESKLLIPNAFSTANYTIYDMPASVIPLLQAGDHAMPVLRAFRENVDPKQMSFAEACISILRGQVLSVSQPFKDTHTGIALVAYTVAPTHQ